MPMPIPDWRMTTTTNLASLVNSGYVASEQTAKKTPLPTIRLLLSAYLLPGNALGEPFLSNLGATTQPLIFKFKKIRRD
jgi:hypothetical protein